jgi:hypothetical protein
MGRISWTGGVARSNQELTVRPSFPFSFLLEPGT